MQFLLSARYIAVCLYTKQVYQLSQVNRFVNILGILIILQILRKMEIFLV